MKKIQWLTLLKVGQLIFFYITITYILPTMTQLFIPQYILLMILFTFLSQSKGFILLIAYMLIIGISYLVLGFINGYDISLEWKAIIYHMTLTTNAAIIYSSTYLTGRLEQENWKLSQRINELEAFVGYTRLLTKQEFEKRSNLIKMAMARRGEEGYQLYFSLEEIDPIIQKSIFSTLTDIALTVFRSEYDLVGKYDDNTFVLLLQNTDNEGMTIALNRYLSIVRSKVNLKESDLLIKVEYIGIVDNKVMNI
ncbi:hypothetical protein [Alkaliphilus peptidifermentans]|uniref:GGDEF domain-containing protein, diguanylate cyclase (C-di-GMP synthetase) or its enzymatically inactive variants n=1 Tax=Alkaliphilus peptidifermentans DSM 18978 TaxID=1120976 RepID=A0A1G5G4R0_9FIRM|nr:hypothetical protein [Alkaliphilus peptidifermentans]SCY45708.1 hypothetical protein SAMN03080606_01583 [Alkaliphilus peptidifermentans DSM 18978]